MPSYRTEVVVPADRYIFLRLPDHMPVGPATVVVYVTDESDRAAELSDDPAFIDADRDDIEWWEEFDDPVESAD